MLDVAIIGGGPAGSAAAVSLRQLTPTAKIAIFDAGHGERWKPGETLSPGATAILESLGCWAGLQELREEGAALESFGTRAAWGGAVPYEHDFLYSLHGNGWRLNRARFDAMLLDCAEAAGVEVRRGMALMDSAEEDSGWRLELQGAARRARFVIDASGRAARFAAQRGARPVASDKLAGVFVLFEGAKAEDTLIEAAEEGWWYSTTVPGATAVTAWMSDTDLIREMGLKKAECWNAQLARSEHTRARLQGAVAKGTPMIFAAHSQRLSQIGGHGWVAAGDAAMTFDPLSSQGIAKALRSGKLASFVAADFLLRGAQTHDRYAKLAHAEWDEYERAKRMYYREEQRWPEAAFWARRHAEPAE
jgi:flavin-dependent dehydrogenase